MSTYQEPVKITVSAVPSFTLAALNKCIIITDEGVANADPKVNTVGTFVFSSSDEVSEKFGNNSKIFKGVQYFLGQKQYPAKQPLIPEFFTVLAVETGKTEADIIQALKDAGGDWYAIGDVCADGKLTEKGMISFLNEYRKYRFYDKGTTETIDDDKKSDRQRPVFNAKTSGDDREWKALADMALNITNGAGSKSDMNITTLCSADISGGKRQTLTAANINFTEKRTSKDYVVVRMGTASDGTSTDETTALDAIIYNMMDNIELFMAEKGFKQDATGYNDVESLLKKVMGTMGDIGLVAVKDNGQYDFVVHEVTQSEAERQLKVIKPKITFVLADWAKRVELTLERSYGTTGGEA